MLTGIRVPRLLAALAALLVASPVLAQIRSEEYGVQPGDQVVTDFYTAGGEALAAVEGERIVDRLGNVFFPYVGTVHVQGLDAEAIRQVLTERFEPFYTNPVVTVNVRLRVNITGVVASPGHYLLDPTSTIVDALATAGGAAGEVTAGNTVAGNPRAIRLVRDGATTTLNLRPDEADPMILSMRVQSGDWIHVPPLPRSRVRDEVQFWGSVLSLFTSVVAAVFLVTR